MITKFAKYLLNINESKKINKKDLENMSKEELIDYIENLTDNKEGCHGSGGGCH